MKYGNDSVFPNRALLPRFGGGGRIGFVLIECQPQVKGETKCDGDDAGAGDSCFWAVAVQVPSS